HLRDIDPYISTELLLADLYSWDNRYGDADDIYAKVAKDENVDRADVLTRQGRVAMWQGGFAGARRSFSQAPQLQQADTHAHQQPLVETAQAMHQLDVRTSPEGDADGGYYVDNHDRASYSAGPTAKLHLTDSLSMSATYRYRELTDQHFD